VRGIHSDLRASKLSIVFWRLKDNAHGNDKATNARPIKKRSKASPAGFRAC